MTLAALVDKVGRMNQYLQQHGNEWGDQEWLVRWKKLDELDGKMAKGLKAAGQGIQHFNWTVTPEGLWHRIGDPPPPPRMNMAQIAKEFPAFARAAAREQQEEGQPELFTTSGDLAGSCPF